MRSVALFRQHFQLLAEVHFRGAPEEGINDNALVAITLLVAQSEPNQKEIMVDLIINLIKDELNG